MVSVKAISDYINSFAPYGTKCDWDNCGILIGDENEKVEKIGFALDLTGETLNECVKNNIDLLITHHPIIFHAQKNFLKGDLSFELCAKGINAISAHTCFDCADGGVNDTLAEILGLFDVKKVESDQCVVPMARLGKTQKCTGKDFAKKVAEKLGTTVRFVDCGKDVEYVAVCGGAGMDFIDDVIRDGADLFVTGDISHHQMLDSKQRGISVVAAGHYETEYPSMEALRKKIENEFDTIETLLLKQSNPVEFIG